MKPGSSLFPNLHCLVLPTPFSCGPVNVYLAAGDPLTLVDAGPRTDQAWEALGRALDGHGVTVEDIQRVVVTHAHVDHFGLAARIAAASGAQVLALAYNRPQLENYAAQEQDRVAFYEGVLRRGGVPAPVVEDTVNQSFGDLARYGEGVPAVAPLADGDVLDIAGAAWTVLHTPGHAIGHLCLYQPDARLLVSGDHLIQHISSNPVVEPPAPGEDERPRSLVLYLESLQRVADLEVDLTLPGHGDPIADHRALVGVRLRHHQVRTNRILATLNAHPRTAYEIVQEVFANPSPLDVFLGLSEVIGHLDVLVTQGRVVEEEAGGLTHYRRS